MDKQRSDTIIIGAGLTGLVLARLLRRAGRTCLVLEARDRPGGRILTSRTAGGTPLELGATWLGKKHTELLGLLEELDLEVFPQQTGGKAIYEAISTSPPQVVQLPPNDEPSYRIVGGTDRVIARLVADLPASTLHCEEPVLRLQVRPGGVSVTTSRAVYRAERVVSTLPPHLLLRSVDISPELPAELREVAAATHTWMGESIKVGLRYATPFWRENGGGGTIFSNVGPVTEMYDHATAADDQYALKGFLNGAYHSLSRSERREMVLGQLRKYYGEIVDDYQGYEEAVWRWEPFTFADYHGHVLPHQHNGHPVYHKPYLSGRLYLAGSETAAQYPGYMDGAVRSAHWVAGQLR